MTTEGAPIAWPKGVPSRPPHRLTCGSTSGGSVEIDGVKIPLWVITSLAGRFRSKKVAEVMREKGIVGGEEYAA